VWFQESLFPCYLFACFNWESQMMEVKGTPGVSSLVSFGAEVPKVPDSVVEALQAQFQGDHPYVVEEMVADGETVTLAGGAFHGLEVKVLKVMAPSGRVQVLMDLLGRIAQVEVEISQVARSARANTVLEHSVFGKHGAPDSGPELHE
jgi:transcription antitermination factor NusG